MSYAEWREVMDVILDGAFRCVQACLPALKKNGGTHHQYRRHERAYRLQGPRPCHDGQGRRWSAFTRALAHDLAADKITANCVVPGAIDTTRPASAQKPAHHLTHGTITGERGKPEDVAAMVRYLCGPGGRYVTGQTIHVSGGAYLGS